MTVAFVLIKSTQRSCFGSYSSSLCKRFLNLTIGTIQSVLTVAIPVMVTALGKQWPFWLFGLVVFILDVLGDVMDSARLLVFSVFNSMLRNYFERQLWAIRILSNKWLFRRVLLRMTRKDFCLYLFLTSSWPSVWERQSSSTHVAFKYGCRSSRKVHI